MIFTEYRAVRQQVLHQINLNKLINLAFNHTSLTGRMLGKKNYDPKGLIGLIFCLQQKAKCSLEICVRLSIAQVTNTQCTQGTYSFPVSAIISEQAVDLILHKEGKTNIRSVTVMQINCIFLKVYWLQTISCFIRAIDILVTLPSWVFSSFAYAYWTHWQQQEKLIHSNRLARFWLTGFVVVWILYNIVHWTEL